MSTVKQVHALLATMDANNHIVVNAQINAALEQIRATNDAAVMAKTDALIKLIEARNAEITAENQKKAGL